MTHVFNRHTQCCFIFFITLFFALPCLASAEGYVSIAGIPGLNPASNPDMSTYVENIMRIAIIGAALIAVIKLILAGAQYVLSGIVTDKEQAKTDIKSALIGLLIVLGAVTILTTINPSLTGLPSLEDAPTVDAVKNLSPTPAKTICDSPAGCVKKSCDTFGTPSYKWFTYLLPQNLIGDMGGELACKLICTEWYGGVVENDICIYSEDLDVSTAYVVEKVIEREEMCEADGCRAIECQFWRWEWTCSSWCENKGGVHIDIGIVEDAQCVVPTPIADELE